MNAHRLRTLTRRYNFVALLVALLSTIVFAYGVMSGAAQSPANQDGGTNSNIQRPLPMPGPFGEDMAKEFNDDDLKVKGEKPRGKWGFALLFDRSQFDDSSVPVAVAGIQSMSGGRKYRGVTKIKRVGIENRSPRILSSIQLSWTIASLDNPAKVLLKGSGHLVNIWVEADSSQVVEIPTLYPALLFKPLAKNGELNGRFQLTIGVQEARFADGSFWRRQEPVAFLKFVYFDRSLDGQFPTLASTVLGTFPLPSNTPNHRIKMAPCEAKPRSTASAFSFMPLQKRSCVEDMASFFDEEGRQSCSQPAPGIACYSDCSSTGHCNVWEGPAPCENMATPPPPPCAEPKPADCCARETVTNPTTQVQECRWNCRPPHCGPGAVFADGCVSTGGPVVCPDGYTFVARHPSGAACCPVAPTPTPTPAAQGMEGYGGTAFCGIDLPPSCMDGIDNDGDGLTDGGDPGCVCPSPVLVDTRGDGFSLTGASAGVLFDIAATGRPLRLSWTPAGSDDAWLALDRDGDGLIGNGRELFGNYTEQPPSPGPNGFLALALFDGAERGGNSDGVIDARDAVFASLRLWRDADHDGVSRPSELFTLQSLDVARLRLSYKESRRVDEHGNRFRYRAQVEDAKGARVGRWAWDVFLVPAP